MDKSVDDVEVFQDSFGNKWVYQIAFYMQSALSWSL